MDYITIKVPNMNDSVSRIKLRGKRYHLRFTYNDTMDYWSFGLYTPLDEPIIQGVKIVPGIPLNAFYSTDRLPRGYFFAETNNDRIGRDDFHTGKAFFAFAPYQ